jgi:hypothetical protein
MDLKLFEERLGILRAELLDEVVRFASVTGDVSEDESDALTAMTPRYLRTAWELVQGITSADAALVVYDRLHDLEADLMKDAPMHFGCISVTRGVLAAEATYRQDSADPAYTHANSLMFDALVRRAVAQAEAGNNFPLVHLAGMRDGVVRCGVAFDVVSEGDAFFHDGGDFPKANREAKVRVTTASGETIIVVDRHGPDSPFV